MTKGNAADDDEGLNFKQLFEGIFGDTGAMERRRELDRRAGMSAKQRARSKGKSEQMNFRASPAFKNRMKAASAKLGLSVSDIFEQAITEFLDKKGA